MNNDQLKKITQNNRAIYKQYISLTNMEEFDGINELLKYIKTKKSICLNIKLESLNAVLASKEYLNAFQLGYDKDSIKERYNSISPYYDKFIKFVELFDPEKKIKYASLRTGGMGSNYPGFGSGQIAIILKDEFIKKFEEEIFGLTRFSLNYFKNDLSFQSEKFFDNISTWNYIEYLAVIKHKDEFKNRIENWDFMLSNSKGWLEVLIYQRILIDNFDEILFEAEYLDYLKNLNLRNDLSQYDNTQNFHFRSILTLMERNNINLDSNLHV